MSYLTQHLRVLCSFIPVDHCVVGLMLMQNSAGISCELHIFPGRSAIECDSIFAPFFRGLGIHHINFYHLKRQLHILRA